MARRSSYRSAPSRVSSRSSSSRRRVSSSKNRSSKPVSAAAPPSIIGANSVSPASSIGGGILGTVIQGMAFGTGSSLAHRAVDSALGPRHSQLDHGGDDSISSTNKITPVNTANACDTFGQKFAQCMMRNNNETFKCQDSFMDLSRCQSQAGETMFPG